MMTKVSPIGVDTHDELWDAMLAFVKLTLLFHSPGPWDDKKQQQWAQLQEPVLSLSTMRGNPHRRDGIHDVTTKRLCDLGRAIIG